MQTNNQFYVECAKFIQNTILEQNIPCYLIGGALINSLRDDGKLLTDDIDFAVIVEGDIDIVLKILEKSGFIFSWERFDSVLRIFPLLKKELKIELFLFVKRHVNYYMHDIQWLHERICGFQTFKQEKVVLENKELITFFRPDLFLTTVYGDWHNRKDGYFHTKSGNTDHLKECVFYTNEDNYDKIDFQIENLKIIFRNIVVKRNLKEMNYQKINIFDDFYLTLLPRESNLLYSDFIKFFIKEDIKYFDI